jgi:hypothetical protein
MRITSVATLLACVMATPAHAMVGFVLTTEITETSLIFDYSIPPWEQEEVVSPPYMAKIKIASNSWSELFSADGPLQCGYDSAFFPTPCLASTRTGNTWSLTGVDLDTAYQSLQITLTFDQNIEFHPEAITTSNFVSGHYSWGYGHHNGTQSADGAIQSISGIPEPASWAMMVGGLGLIGASLRRRKPSLRPT